MKMPGAAEKIIEKLEERGYSAYMVGGCVRDMLLGREPEDWDIATSATPMEVKALFKRTYDTGIEHGTVTVRESGQSFEVTTFRADGSYEDFRHPKEVFFTKDIYEDLKRRDFTMNALAYHPKTGFIDPSGGVEDIKAGVIRGVGAPAERFREDALRMLRAVRFSAQLGFCVEGETLTAVYENAPLLRYISAERVREELQKAICGRHLDALALLWETGLLRQVSPELSYKLSGEGQSLISKLKSMRKDPMLRWAAVLSYLDEPEKAMQDLKFSNKHLKTVSLLCRERSLSLSPDGYSIKKEVFRIGLEEFRLLLEFRKEEGLAAVAEALDGILERGECIFMRDMKINGDELIKLGVQKGADVGRMLNVLLDAVHRTPELNDNAALAGLVRRTLGALPPDPCQLF